MSLTRDLWPLLKETLEKYQKDGIGQLGAALAYYAMFSFFPLLLLLIAGLGFVLRFWSTAIDVQQETLNAAARAFSPQFSETLGEMLAEVQAQAGMASWIGALTLLIGASGVFYQLSTCLNRIWAVSPEPTSSGIIGFVLLTLRQRLFAFLIVLATGFLVIVSLILTTLARLTLSLLTPLPYLSSLAAIVLGLVVTLALNTLIFCLLFKYLPDTDVRWDDVWGGALGTALIWEMAKRLLALYLERSSYLSAYGIVGTVLVLMFWVYASSQILFLGAEFTSCYARKYGSRASDMRRDEG